MRCSGIYVFNRIMISIGIFTNHELNFFSNLTLQLSEGLPICDICKKKKNSEAYFIHLHQFRLIKVQNSNCLIDD